MTTLVLVRHGETYDNAKKILQGQIQGELNETGIIQAEQVRDELAQEAIDAFVASDLNRSIQTAQIIAEPHHKAVVTTPLLRERDWGEFTGKYIPDLENMVWPDNVESLEHLQQRARQFLDFLRTRFPNQRVVAVGHGIVNQAVQAVLFGKPMNQIVRMNNGEIRIMEL